MEKLDGKQAELCMHIRNLRVLICKRSLCLWLSCVVGETANTETRQTVSSVALTLSGLVRVRKRNDTKCKRKCHFYRTHAALAARWDSFHYLKTHSCVRSCYSLFRTFSQLSLQYNLTKWRFRKIIF